jgi:hypothetical protein
MEQLDSYLMNFREISYSNMLRKFGFAYSQADNIGQLVYRPKYAYNNSPLNSFQNEEVSDESCK